MSDCGDNRVDFEDGATSRFSIYSAVQLVQHGAAGIGHLLLVVQSRGFFVVDPLEGHAGHISAQDELGESARRRTGDNAQIIVIAVVGAFEIDT
jgi:hypothetical protein